MQNILISSGSVRLADLEHSPNVFCDTTEKLDNRDVTNDN